MSQFKAQAYTFVHDLNSKKPLIQKILGDYPVHEDPIIGSPSPTKLKFNESPVRNKDSNLKEDEF